MEITETSTHILSKKNDILHCKVKHVDITFDNVHETIKAMREMNEDESKKCLVIVDPNDSKVLNSKIRAHIQFELDKFVDAMAIINKSMLTTLLFNFIIKVNKPKYPMKAFKDQNEAEDWLAKYKW